MNKLYIVCGDNGIGNSGTVILGVYTDIERAENRIKTLDEDIKPEYVYYEVVDCNGADNGVDCEVYIGG